MHSVTISVSNVNDTAPLVLGTLSDPEEAAIAAAFVNEQLAGQKAQLAAVVTVQLYQHPQQPLVTLNVDPDQLLRRDLYWFSTWLRATMTMLQGLQTN